MKLLFKHIHQSAGDKHFISGRLTISISKLMIKVWQKEYLDYAYYIPKARLPA
jgi:hypothetical protein